MKIFSLSFVNILLPYPILSISRLEAEYLTQESSYVSSHSRPVGEERFE